MISAMLAGCGLRLGQPTIPGRGPPTMDRLVAAYDDLGNRRLQIIADFESAVQAGLFRPVEGAAGCTAGISTERAREQTGVGALKMVFSGPGQRVAAEDRTDSDWTLHRDWSRFNLLIVSVYSPRRLGGFTVSLSSGVQPRMVYVHPRVLLESGWNLLRIDLDEASERVDLADIRQLAFSCDPLDAPVELFADDVVLTDNTRELYAAGDRESGDLYVLQRGRQLVVGSVERFEVAFAQGRIRRWFDPVSDSARNHNLVGSGSLGPMPVVLHSETHSKVALDDPSQWNRLGTAAEVRQLLLEATPLRAVVECRWRFSSAVASSGEDGPSHHWVYTVYHDGRIYVGCDGTARGPEFQPPGLGVAFCCDGDQGFRRQVIESNRPVAAGAPIRASYALFSRPGDRQADLLIVPFLPIPARMLENAADSRQCVLWEAPVHDERFSFAAMLRLWPGDVDSPLQAGPMAADYWQPMPLAVDSGRLVRTEEGDLDNDGYNESRGEFVLRLDGTTGRVRVDARRGLRFSPVFKIVEVAGSDVWVYVDGKLLRAVYRDAADHVLFAVPGVISGEVLIEVLARKQGT